MSTTSCPKCGKQPCSCPPREFSGKWVVGILLTGGFIFGAIALGLFYFHFFDVLKEYRKTVPPLPRSMDRG